MNWYQGDIAQAVAESRTKNAIFVVFVAGNDANSDKLMKMIDEEKVRSKLESENFVAIRIESGSQSYMQFASIYQMVPVPSIFFIGNTGTPIEIGTAVMNSVDELDEKIKRAIDTHSNKMSHNDATASSSAASSSLIAAEKKTTHNETKKPAPNVAGHKDDGESTESPIEAKTQNEDIVCDGDVCYKKPKEKETNVKKDETGDSNLATVTSEGEVENGNGNEGETPDFEARLAATREVLAQKRREALEEEKKQEKERELRRRREGKEIQNLQEWQREQELKELKANIRRERLEEQAARERIRAKIAADRAERAQRFGALDNTAITAPKESTPPKPPVNPSAVTDTVRLQFRLSSGEAHAHTFNTRDTISIVRNYVIDELLAGSNVKDFTLATAYPRHEFTSEEDDKSLLDMGLFPSAVILVITKESSKPAAIIRSHGGIINMVSSVFWAMISPIFSVLNYLRGTIFGGRNENIADGTAATGAQKRANEDSQVHIDAAKRRNIDRFMVGPSTSRDVGLNPHQDDTEQKPYRRYGSSNVHRLSDNRKDSDDENATWNGNSTQQQ